MKRKHVVRLVVLGVIVAGVILLLRFTEVGEALRPANLEANKEQLFGRVQENYLLAVLIFIAVYIAVVALSIPGATVLTLLGGFFFGGVSGMAGVGLASIYVNVGATAGAFLVFLAARFFLGDMVHAKYGAKLERFDAELAENGKNYLLTMRFIPIFPFWMINLLAGVARVAPITFLWTTSIGIIPGSIVYNYVGYAFGSLGGEADKAIRNVVFALLALALISIMPVILKKVRKRLNSR
jgi:uncharacterized membrane protein YdjX (TVP38/TMEM64 family)